MNTKDFLSSLKARSFSPRTVETYAADLELFAGFLRSRRLRLTQVTPKVVEQFIEYANQESARRGRKEMLSPASVRRTMAALSSFFKWRSFQSNGKTGNPVPLVPRPRLGHREARPVDELALEALLQGIDNARDRAVVAVFVASGLRLAELHQLNLDSIQVDEITGQDGVVMTLGVGHIIGKGNKERAFLIDAGALRCLEEYLRERGEDGLDALFVSSRRKRLSRRSIQDRIRVWCQRLGLKRLHVHQFRHTFASRMADGNVSPLVLRELMGHRSFATTQRYIKFDRRKLSREYFAAMELHSGRPGRPGRD
jgi:integrase/recombinase XerC